MFKSLIAFLAVALTVAVPNGQRPLDRESKAQLPGSRDLKPEPAIPAILSAFKSYQVVGMNVGHGQKDIDDFILALVRDPAFPRAVDDIVLEGMNSLFQAVLDRYVAGGDVSIPEVQTVWRTTSIAAVWGIHDQLIPLVRTINQTLPAADRLRMVAGEPPVDWTLMKSSAEVSQYYTRRDSNLAAVMEKEVLAPGRKALVLYGTGHLARGWREMALTLWEQNHPGKSLVIFNHGCGGGPGLARTHAELEARMKDWPIPSLALIKGTWFGELMDPAIAANAVIRLPPYSSNFDAYLYLGPSHRLLHEPTPAHVFADSAFMAELRRRESWGFKYDILDPDKMRARGSDPLLCGPDGKRY
jgi:hypothetical protein